MNILKTYSINSKTLKAFDSIVGAGNRSKVVEELMAEYVLKQSKIKKDLRVKRQKFLEWKRLAVERSLEFSTQAKLLTRKEFGLDLLTDSFPSDWSNEKKKEFKKKWVEKTKELANTHYE